MPELPEVETVVRALRPQLIGRCITAFRCQWPRHIDRPDIEEFRQRIIDSCIQDVSRRGKFIIISLEQVADLIIHLRMSGHLAVVDVVVPQNKHDHTIFALDNDQELRFRDTRKFGRVYLVDNTQEVLGKLGLEPLDPTFTTEQLQQIMAGHKRILKPFLLDQTKIAGIGNIYADEALFHASLLPTRRTDSLTEHETIALHAGIQDVLRQGIAREGASISTYIKPDGEKGDMQNAVQVFRRTGQTCYRCDGTIQRIIVGGRSTHFCPGCQK
jgi:formamidopyrimidine-DNA glycosylase